MNYAISLLNNSEYKQSWQQVLLQLADQANLHGLLAGRSCRLLLDAGVVFNRNDTSRRLANLLYLTPANLLKRRLG